MAPELRCTRCASSKLFAFLQRQASKATDEQALISAIKALPGHQVFPGNGCVVIARTSGNSVSQRSVWLNRASTIANLQSFLEA